MDCRPGSPRPPSTRAAGSRRAWCSARRGSGPASTPRPRRCSPRAAELCQTDDDLARIANARAYNLPTCGPTRTRPSPCSTRRWRSSPTTPPRLQAARPAGHDQRLFEPDPEGALTAAAPLLASDDDATSSAGAATSSSIALAFLGRGEEAVSVAYAGLQRHRRAMRLHPATRGAADRRGVRATPRRAGSRRREADAVDRPARPAWPPVTRKGTRPSCSCRAGC